MKHLLITAILLFAFIEAKSQHSIHAEENAKYKSAGVWQDDNVQTEKSIDTDTCSLRKIVFGYHPYWVGSVWKNYNWNLLSDLCYFSYEVDPATGLSTTQNDWQTAAVIDTALAHGTRVHLCITLFSGHSTFFSSTQAKAALIDTTIKLLQARHAQGVNLDFEAVSSSLALQYNEYLIAFADSLHNAIPGSIISIAAPAVDWSGMLDLAELSQHLDYFMIMGYDYYWSGSSTAGPEAGLYPMESGYQYGVSSTISWYLKNGVPAQKLLLGVPYYGRDWSVNKETAPAGTTGSSFAVTYKNYRNNDVDYNWSTEHFEPNSQSLYYSYELSGWRQCFIDDAKRLGAKYDLVNRSSLAGIGIWALGYDNGYSDLWAMLREKFSTCAPPLCSDTLYDSGGPAFSYKQNEDYIQTFSIAEGQPLTIDLLDLETESGADSLLFYDGLNTSAPLLAAYSGVQSPATLFPTGNSITFRFKSNASNQQGGWKFVYKCPSAGENEIFEKQDEVIAFPNPCNGDFVLHFHTIPKNEISVEVLNISGQSIWFEKISVQEKNIPVVPGKKLKSGMYLVKITDRTHAPGILKILVN